MTMRNDPLTFDQLQTPANRIAREAAEAGQFPGPIVPSQQFSIQRGLAQLNSRESEMLQRIVGRLKRQREADIAPIRRSSAVRQFGGAFGL